MLVSPTRLVFVTAGSGSCPSLPTALDILGPTAIHMRLAMYDPNDGACTNDFTTTDVEVAVDPIQIDISHVLTIHLVYPDGGRLTLLAPGLGLG